MRALDDSATGTPPPLFILRLAHLLENAPREIVSWSDDGLSFLVHQPTLFAAQVLPVYYGYGTLSTFMQQLAFFGFHRCSHRHDDDDQLEFRHLSFDALGHDAGQIKTRFKERLEPDDRAIVDEIEQEIFDIQRLLVRQSMQERGDLEALTTLLDDTISTSPSTSSRGTHMSLCHTPPQATLAPLVTAPELKLGSRT
ncbi:Aste57867_11594 [Aphanomyces stellatus]|uniref:Aste57867_11594 protein n=1 Tax=Aphanomyces stellatus TaxID=120398 RepID=A0A485KVA7_9STRA|nr:hypothetical protein As57867_011551 [Aphanomyces stellatus]VFT88453.1 Aste57867_11594 [Aphanomyces stellatus]